MKKYTQANWITLIAVCSAGLLLAAFRIYRAYGKIDSTGVLALSILVVMVLIILYVVRRRMVR